MEGRTEDVARVTREDTCDADDGCVVLDVSMTDAHLIAQAAQGDVEAYAVLVRRYYPMCARIAQRMLRDAEDAEDAVQDTFLRAFRALGRFDHRKVFRAWLLRILVNQCRTHALKRRRRERRFPRDEIALRDTPSSDGHATFETDERQRVIDAVESLEPLLREAFLLKYVEELEYKEMAEITGASISALKMRVKRACEALRPRLEGIYHE
jgi:RNA polymerase sigma-70 factor, ECF subfamily